MASSPQPSTVKRISQDTCPVFGPLLLANSPCCYASASPPSSSLDVTRLTVRASGDLLRIPRDSTIPLKSGLLCSRDCIYCLPVPLLCIIIINPSTIYVRESTSIGLNDFFPSLILVFHYFDVDQISRATSLNLDIPIQLIPLHHILNIAVIAAKVRKGRIRFLKESGRREIFFSTVHVPDAKA